MKVPSHKMVPRTERGKLNTFELFLILAIIGGIVWFCHDSIWHTSGILLLMVLLWLGARRSDKHFSAIRNARTSESICSFAHQLPARFHDTWVVRATYEELSGELAIPIRPTDRLKKDLLMDEEDLEDFALEIAHRSGRTLQGPATIPYQGEVTTVADLITFIELQTVGCPSPEHIHTGSDFTL